MWSRECQGSERPPYLCGGRTGGAEVRKLHALGFEIGCHSLTHPYLTDVDDNRLHEETAGAKDMLEQIAGVRVDHFSCPGGRWDARVMRAVKQANFRTMATSQTGVNLSTTNPFALTRVTMLSGTKSDDLMGYCQGRGLLRTQLEEKARDAAKRVLGNSMYDSLRGLIVRGRLR